MAIISMASEVEGGVAGRARNTSGGNVGVDVMVGREITQSAVIRATSERKSQDGRGSEH